MIPGCVNIVRSSRGRGQSSGYSKSLVEPKWTPWQSVKCGISWILVAESLQKEAPLSVGLQARQVLRPPRVAFLRRPQAFVCHPTCFSAFSSLEKLHSSSPHPPNLKTPRRRTGMAGKILALEGTSGSSAISISGTWSHRVACVLVSVALFSLCWPRLWICI